MIGQLARSGLDLDVGQVLAVEQPAGEVIGTQVDAQVHLGPAGIGRPYAPGGPARDREHDHEENKVTGSKIIVRCHLPAPWGAYEAVAGPEKRPPQSPLRSLSIGREITAEQDVLPAESVAPRLGISGPSLGLPPSRGRGRRGRGHHRRRAGQEGSDGQAGEPGHRVSASDVQPAGCRAGSRPRARLEGADPAVDHLGARGPVDPPHLNGETPAGRWRAPHPGAGDRGCRSPSRSVLLVRPLPRARRVGSRAPAPVPVRQAGPVHRPTTGPASRRSTMIIRLTPASGSPARMVAATGAAPRWRGRREGGRSAVDAARPRAGGRTSSPYDTSRSPSGGSRRPARASADAAGLGVRSGRPAVRAASATGEARCRSPRPAG